MSMLLVLEHSIKDEEVLLCNAHTFSSFHLLREEQDSLETLSAFHIWNREVFSMSLATFVQRN